MDAYSVPCAPATSASVGPGRAPLTTMTGMLAAVSLPAATAITPFARVPGRAVAVPMVRSAASAGRQRAAANNVVNVRRIGDSSSIMDWRRALFLRWKDDIYDPC